MLRCRRVREPVSILAAGAAILLGASGLVRAQASLPPSAETARDWLNGSPRHGEWVKVEAGEGDVVDAWLVYPERSDKAPVVVVVHEIFGLTDWIRAVADALAAEGFIAIAPDLLSGKGPDGGGSDSVDRDGAVRLVRGLDWAEVVRRLDATARFATSLPAATERFGIVGFCWGGRTSFAYATEQPDLDAAVVYYGTSPEKDKLAAVRAPVLGLYGGADERVNATVPPAQETMKALGKLYEVEIYEGAGHGFLRAQDRQEGANRRAAEKAWPRTIAFLKRHLEH